MASTLDDILDGPTKESSTGSTGDMLCLLPERQVWSDYLDTGQVPRVSVQAKYPEVGYGTNASESKCGVII